MKEQLQGLPETPECIACTYSGADEERYRAYGCPACTCGRLIKEELDKLQVSLDTFHKKNNDNDNRFHKWLAENPAMKPANGSYENCKAAWDAGQIHLKEELKKQDARMLFFLNHMTKPTVMVMDKLFTQVNILLKALSYYANLDSWEEDMEGHASYRNKIKDDSSDEAGVLRWVRRYGGKRARVATEEYVKIEKQFLLENPK